MSLLGKVALVTGSGQRLGCAIATALAENGADLVLHSYRSSVDEVMHAVQQHGRRAFSVQGDLSVASEVYRVAHEVLDIAGRVDILVNNAAMFMRVPIQTVTRESWNKMIGLNLTAPFLLSLLLGRTMHECKRGVIIHIGDWIGIRPIPGYLPYCLTKGGLHGLTSLLAKAFAPFVCVNAIAPGPVLPPLSYGADALHVLAQNTPLRRLGTHSDVTRAVCFLADYKRGVTGATYCADGGWFVQAPIGNTSL